MPLHVQHVRSTLKGGVDTPLGPKTLITGPNGAGKSRIVQAVELGLCGYASDVTGRPQVRSGSDLIELAPPSHDLDVTVKLSDGREGTFLVARKGKGKTAKPEAAPPAGVRVVFPAVDALAALRGSKQTARRFVLAHAGLKLDTAAVEALLPPTLLDTYRELLPADSDPVEGLLAVASAAEKGAKAKRAEAGSQRKLVESLEVHLRDGTEATAEAIEAAQEAVRVANEEYTAAAKLPEPVDLAGLHQRATAAIARFRDQQATVGRLSTLAGGDLAETEDSIKAREALVTLLRLTERHTAHPADQTCLLCTQAVRVDPADYGRRAGAMEAAGSKAASVALARQKLPRAQEALAAYKAEATTLAKQYDKLYKAQEANGPKEGVNRTLAIRGAYTRLTEAEKALAALQKRSGALATIEDAESTVMAAETQAETLDDLRGACLEVEEKLIKRAREGFVAAVQSFLPEDDRFDLLLKRHGKDVCLFGFRRAGNALHTALSGAEWARLTLALGAVSVPAGDDVLAILTPEERAYDSATLGAVMRALSDAPCQVILTAPNQPRGRTPAGWDVVTVEGDDNG